MQHIGMQAVGATDTVAHSSGKPSKILSTRVFHVMKISGLICFRTSWQQGICYSAFELNEGEKIHQVLIECDRSSIASRYIYTPYRGESLH